ncbi:MAG: SRPBCC domain-containing protein [Hyphomicrobiaceae bacterium]|nr:SRPBCC domain-containing protein [Hyphomicrobiaceae bacterium]
MSPAEALEIWSLDREIVLSRVLAASADDVFQAWTGSEHLQRWFGPEGFATETVEIDVREGGRWRFFFVGPDGERYANRIVFRAVVAPWRLVFDHGPDQDEDESVFRVTVTVDEQADGRSVVSLRQLHPTKEQRDSTVGFGAVELGYQSLERLARYVEKGRP